ncbi:MAG: cation-translocating P-type ATPase, partial [Bacteroidota bacterium]
MGKELIELKVDGMDCNNCAMSVSRYLERRGLEDVFVNFQTKEVRFRPGPDTLDLEKIKTGIHKLGFVVVEEEAAAPTWTLERKLIVSAIFTLPLLLGHLLLMTGLELSWLASPAVQFALALPVFLIGVTHFGRSALNGLLQAGVPNMDVLIFVGSSAAFVYSTIGWYLQDPTYYFFETAATIISLVLLGNWMEKRAVAQTTTAIGALTELQVPMANRLLPSGEVLPVAKTKLKLGMLLQINEGDLIPTDAVVKEGEGLLDESMLTGESMPVLREKGQEIIGGSTLISGTLQAEVIAVGKNTVLEQMVELVKTAQQDKPPIQQLADRISAIFVPVVLSISILTFLVSYFVLEISSGQALLRAIAVLVVSCPCAMGLATPTAVMVGVGRLARLGVLIKGGRTVEQLANIQHLVFDKTGTLTTGKFRIESAKYPSGEMKLANALVWEMERHSSHPIAQSLRQALDGVPRSENVPQLEIKEQRGIGMVAGGADGYTYRLGSRRLLDETYNCEGDIFLLQDQEVMAVFRL